MPGSAPTVTLPTVDEEWRTYRNKVLPKGCPDTQVIECRRAFYAGAWALFNLQLRVGEPDVSVAQGVEAFESIGRELVQFNEQVKAGAR